MEGRIVRGRCGAMAERGGHAAGVDFAGFGKRREGGFDGKGVFVQPFEEGGFAEEAGVGVLGGMNVGVWTGDLVLLHYEEMKE